LNEAGVKREIKLMKEIEDLKSNIVNISQSNDAEVNEIRTFLTSKIEGLKSELLKIHDFHSQYVEYAEMEIKLVTQICEKLEEQNMVFKENAKKMRAVLRIPRLCNEFHENLKVSKNPEFNILEGIYE
jgi:hypothetical protein